MGRETKEVGAMPTCYCLILCVASLVFSTFSVYKVVYHEHPFAFSPISVMPQSQEHILGWPYLRQIKSDRLAEYDDVIRGPPL